MNGNTANGPDCFSEEFSDWCAEQVEARDELGARSIAQKGAPAMGKVFDLFDKTRFLREKIASDESFFIRSAAANSTVGLFISPARHDGNKNDWRPEMVDVARAAMKATIAKLEPAIEAVFRKALAAEIEALRLNAIDEIQGELRAATYTETDDDA